MFVRFCSLYLVTIDTVQGIFKFSALSQLPAAKLNTLSLAISFSNGTPLGLKWACLGEIFNSSDGGGLDRDLRKILLILALFYSFLHACM